MFNNLIMKYANIIDPVPIEPPYPDTFELIKPKGMEDLRKLIKRFNAFNYFNCILCIRKTVAYRKDMQDFKEKRKDFLVRTLRKLSPEKIIKDDGSVKETHGYLKFIQIFIRLCRVRIVVIVTQYHLLYYTRLTFIE
jgi:hypothetical protein